jgi:hypothetical protein
VTGYRIRIVVFLIAYFAGIATGIFVAMPAATQRNAAKVQGSAARARSAEPGRNGAVVRVSRTARVEAHPVAEPVAMQDAQK